MGARGRSWARGVGKRDSARRAREGVGGCTFLYIYFNTPRLYLTKHSDICIDSCLSVSDPLLFFRNPFCGNWLDIF